MAQGVSALRTDFYVYALFREDGRVFYIGKGTGRRWTAHERWLDRSHKSSIIRKTKAALGFLPKEKIAEGLTDAEARQIEVDMIRLVGRAPLGPLVNLTDGGDGVSNPSPESRAKMSQAKKGRIVSEETRRRLSAAQKGKPLSPAFAAVIGKWNIGRKASAEHKARLSTARRGKKHSEETKAKIGAAHRGRPKSPEQIEKQRAAITGRVPTEQERANMRAAHLRRKMAAQQKAPQTVNLGA